MDRRIEEHLAYLSAVRGLSSRTVRSYREDLERFEAFLSSVGANVDEVGTRELRAFAAELVSEGKAASSVNRALSAVRGYYRYRVRFGALAVDPSRDLESLSTRRNLPRFLFEADADAFISGVSGDDFRSVRDRAILELLYSTGCRVGEAAGLTLDRLDLAGGTARVRGKGSKERIVFLAQPARSALAAYLGMRAARVARSGALARRRGRSEGARSEAGPGAEPVSPTGTAPGPARRNAAAEARPAGERSEGEYLFINARGGRLTERGIEWLIEGYAERAGLHARVTPHSFRHSFATHLVGRGADIRVVQELLGHSSVSTTQIYTHVDMERLRKVYDQAHPHGGRGK